MVTESERTVEEDGPGRDWRERLRRRVQSLDGIERFSVVLFSLGATLLLWGSLLEPPGSANGFIARHYSDWAPGLLTDAILLWVVNSILRRHERHRVLCQIGSLSREFALDAVRRARDEGWLRDGSLRNRKLPGASLSGADLSSAAFPGADLSFADLRSASLPYADLSGANLTGANLSEADLRWADLRRADLRWADLRGALLDGTKLEGAVGRFASVDAREGQEPVLAGAVVNGFLDDDQIAEVRRTFDLLMEEGAGPIEEFYCRLFRAAPETRAMFRSEPERQARKFLQSLKVIVSALHQPTRHVTVLQRLGERHHGYGVERGHYALVGATLIDVLADTLGEEFTPAARASWERAFHLMATVMIEGTDRAGPVRAAELSAPRSQAPSSPRTRPRPARASTSR